MADRNYPIWIKILWSIVILFSISLWIYISNCRSNGIIGFEIYPYFISPVVLVMAIIVAILRKRKAIQSLSFLYILAAVANAYIGVLGI